MKAETTKYLETAKIAMFQFCKPYDLSAAFHAGIEAQRMMPIDVILHCPNCGTQHVDAPEPEICVCGHSLSEHFEASCVHSTGVRIGDICFCQQFQIAWDNPSHKSHLSHGCGIVWRPTDVPTNGVASIETRGEKDTWPDMRAAE